MKNVSFYLDLLIRELKMSWEHILIFFEPADRKISREPLLSRHNLAPLTALKNTFCDI